MPFTTGLNANLAAFLDTIALSELGQAVIDQSDDGYNVLVGSLPGKVFTFDSYAKHPALLNSNITPPSTAAGRYQFLFRYWPAYSLSLRLPDFGKLSQDRWAMQLVEECHATALIAAGNFQEALTACASRWASLPDSQYGQHEQKLSDLRAIYLSAGGALA